MTTYETVAGTRPEVDEQHEPRTVTRTEDDGRLYMMSEIGDGIFVQWNTCRTCSKGVKACKCPGGPVEPEYMQKWRDERFTKSFIRREALPALPELMRHRDRRVSAVLRLLRSQGWTIEPPDRVVAEESIIDPDDTEGASDDPDYGGHIEASIDDGLDAALERVQDGKGNDDVGF